MKMIQTIDDGICALSSNVADNLEKHEYLVSEEKIGDTYCLETTQVSLVKSSCKTGRWRA